jgi:hypothetical protein
MMFFGVRAAISIVSGAVVVISVRGIQAPWVRILAASLVSLRLLLIASLAAFLAWTMAAFARSAEPIYESLLRKQPDVMSLAVSRRAIAEMVSGAGEALLLILILLALWRYCSFTARAEFKGSGNGSRGAPEGP